MNIKLVATGLLAAIAVSITSGCAARVADPYDSTVTYPKGVAYYDTKGDFHEKVPEAISPIAQDRWEEAALITGVVGAAAGVAGVIVATH